MFRPFAVFYDFVTRGCGLRRSAPRAVRNLGCIKLVVQIWWLPARMFALIREHVIGADAKESGKRNCEAALEMRNKHQHDLLEFISEAESKVVTA